MRGIDISSVISYIPVFLVSKEHAFFRGEPPISHKTSTTLLFVVAFYAFILLPLTPLWAQPFDLSEDTDIFAPLIQHQPLEERLQPGSPHLIEARVSDNIGVLEVILYYRKQGQEIYSSINMETIWRGEYSTHIPKEDIETPGIEYYIQAKDHAGNTSQRAFPFSPLRIKVVAASTEKFAEKLDASIVISPVPPIVQKEEKTITDEIMPSEREPFALSTEKPVKVQTMSQEKPWYKKWWVWVIVVSVAGGVVAASSGGGDAPAAGGETGSATISTAIP